jgi:hypothetical protein
VSHPGRKTSEATILRVPLQVLLLLDSYRGSTCILEEWDFLRSMFSPRTVIEKYPWPTPPNEIVAAPVHTSLVRNCPFTKTTDGTDDPPMLTIRLVVCRLSL